MSALQVYIGYDEREHDAYEVAAHSICRHASQPVLIHPLCLANLGQVMQRPIERKDGKLWCPISEAPMATEFAISRFCVPFLQLDGWALFVDCDILCTADISELFALADPKYAVQVVKHPKEDIQSFQVCYDERCELHDVGADRSAFYVWPCNEGCRRENWAMLETLVMGSAYKDSGSICNKNISPTPWTLEPTLWNGQNPDAIKQKLTIKDANGVNIFDVVNVMALTTPECQPQRDVMFSRLSRLIQRNPFKMDAQVQTFYARKNWSSVVLWNCGHPANNALTHKRLNGWPGRDLHAFKWLEDSEIGELPPEWNYLVGVSPKQEHPKIAHFTCGVPSMPGYENCEFADLWRKELAWKS